MKLVKGVKRRSARICTCLVLVLLGSWLVHAQSAAIPQTPTFRSGVELVHVDVVVLDKKTGEPVRGLTAGDFTIIDRAQPQPVAVFTEVNHERDPEEIALPPGLPLDVADNSTARASRVVIIVVDDLHIPTSLTETTRNIVRRLLKDLGPQASVGLLQTSGDGGVEVTDDRALVYRDIGALKGLKGAGMSNMPDHMDRVHHTLKKAAEMMGAATDRRKAFVLISPGLPMEITGLFEAMQPRPPEMGSRNDRTPPPWPYDEYALIDMMESMRRANVATYAINPAIASPAAMAMADRDRPGENDLLSGTPAARGTGVTGDFSWNRPINQMKDYLSLIAAASGGLAVVNAGELDIGLKRLINDLDHYYLLGFYPSKKDKDWHNLEVTVNRDDVTVRFRRGYRLGSTPKPPKNKELLAGFSATLLPKTDLPLKMFATPLPSTGNTTKMAITLQVRAERPPLVDADGSLRDTLDILTMAVDLRKRKIEKAIKRRRLITLKPRADAKAGPDITYQIVSEWDLPPGRYQLRTSAQSAKLGKSGSVYLVVDVPDFRRDAVALSGLIIGYADANHHPVDATSVERSLMPLEPVLDRVFAPADTLRVHYDVWRKDPGAPATTSLEILNDQLALVRTGATAVPTGLSGRVDVHVPLTGLAPGPYVLRIVAAAAGRTSTREVGFFVRSKIDWP